MENNTQSLFAGQALDTPCELAAALAPPPVPGRLDELRGRTAAVIPPTPAGNLPPLPALRMAGSAPAATPDTVNSDTDTDSHSDVAADADAAPSGGITGPLAPHWTRFFDHLGTDGFGDLNKRTANLQRQIRDNGVTYNVYADVNGPQRPWSLDLFPMMVTPDDWAQIEAGVKQRACLLDHVMADIYGPQKLLSEGLLPSALVHGHPGYLRAMQGVKPVGGTFLHIAAFDIAHGPDGRWSVVSQRTQAPSGLGYLLENRLTISLLFPEAYREMQVQPLSASYKALVDGLKAMSPVSDSGSHGESRVVLLTPGPYNETYFEHAYLARFLGLTLVEGSDLLVRDDRLYLKTLRGLEPVHGLLKRLDDEFLDPLELRSDSTLGVPGLLQVIRAGNVLVVNTPGSAFLESTAMLGFLPKLSQHLLGERLALPSLATWWCGEQAVMQEVLGQLKECVIKPTYPGSGMESVIGHTLSQRELDEWAGRIVRKGEDYTVQAYQPLSQTPTWQPDRERIAPRSAMLRVFAVADGQGSWNVLPGGLARLAGKNEHMASMQHGGSSADVWVLRDAVPAAQSSAAPPSPRDAGPRPPADELGSHPGETAGELFEELSAPQQTAQAAADAPTRITPMAAGWATGPLRQRPAVTSRAAENLFWLGRYTERAENSTRLAQLTLQSLGGEDQTSAPLLDWLTEMAVGNALVLDTVPPAIQARRVFERALIANLADTGQAASVGFNLGALKSAASAVRERLSQEQWHVIVRAEADFLHRCKALGTSGALQGAFQVSQMSQMSQSQGGGSQSQGASAAAVGKAAQDYSSVEALKALESASGFLAAMTGAQTDRMMRDDGWRLLSIGRLIERLYTLSAALVHGLQTRSLFDAGGFNAMVALFDSTITFHAQYQQRRDMAALLDLLVLDRDNPRSLGWVVQTLRGRLAKLAGSAPGDLPALATDLPDPAGWMLGELCSGEHFGDIACDHLIGRLEACCDAAVDLSDTLSRRYFSHAASASQSVGA